MEQKISKRKVFIGTVLSDKMDKTRVVQVSWKAKDHMYQKPVRHAAKFKAHDEKNASHAGDRVRIIETRPLSKDKRWLIKEIMKDK